MLNAGRSVIGQPEHRPIPRDWDYTIDCRYRGAASITATRSLVRHISHQTAPVTADTDRSCLPAFQLIPLASRLYGYQCTSTSQSQAMLGFSQVYSGSRVVVMYSSSIYYICTMKPGIDDGLVDIQRWKGRYSHTTRTWCGISAPPHLLPLLIPHPYHCTHNPSDHKQPVTSHYPPSIPYLTMLRGHDAASALLHTSSRYSSHTPTTAHTTLATISNPAPPHLLPLLIPHPYHCTHNPSDHKQPVTSYYPLYTVSYHATRPWCGVTAPPHLLPLLIPHPYHYCTHNPSDHKQPVTSYYPLYTGHDAASAHLHTSSRYSSHTPTTAHTTLATTSNPAPPHLLPLLIPHPYHYCTHNPSDHKQPYLTTLQGHDAASALLHTSSRYSSHTPTTAHTTLATTSNPAPPHLLPLLIPHPYHCTHNPSDHKQPVTAPPHLLPLLIPHPYHYCTHNPSDHKQPYLTMLHGHDAASALLHTSSRYSSHTPTTTAHTTLATTSNPAPPHLLPLLIPHPYHCTHNPSDHKQPVTSHYPPSTPYLTMLRGHDAASALLTPPPATHPTPLPHCTHNPSDHKQPVTSHYPPSIPYLTTLRGHGAASVHLHTSSRYSSHTPTTTHTTLATTSNP
ncbi:hypothetical protein J6590_017813 [Homalodisca vitripennis]|nr:hypothetical protein J6590_017813 [Homalodisca vitripennis]